MEGLRWRGSSTDDTCTGRRQRRRRSAGLPPVALVLAAMAVVVVIVELSPVYTAWSLAATEWWSDVPQLLPVAARSAALLLLPAAVAWATPDRARRNAWLWRGALVVAFVQLLRYPAREASSLVFELFAADETVSEVMYVFASLASSVPLALGTIIGIWALGEGLKDAGGRSSSATLVALVVAIALGLLLLIPSLMAGYQLDLQGVANLVSFALNVLFLFVSGLLAGRAVAGALNGTRPIGAWRAGAVAAVVAWALPSLSYVSLLLSTFVLNGEPFAIPFLGVATYFGWPLFAVALAMGMGRLPVRSPRALGSGFNVRGTALRASRLICRVWRAATLYRDAMPGESFFMAFGGLGLSLAGFAGLIAALNPTGASPAVTAYRIRTIVVLGFSLTFVGFGAVAVHTVTNGDIGATVQIATALMLIPFLRGLLIDTRPGPRLATGS